MVLTNLFKLYLIAIATDLISGIIAAGYEGRLKSATMRQGLWTTVGEVIALILMSSISTLMPEVTYMVDFVVSAMIFKEGISICENLGRAGIWIPPWIKRALEVFSEDTSKLPPGIKDKLN